MTVWIISHSEQWLTDRIRERLTALGVKWSIGDAPRVARRGIDRTVPSKYWCSMEIPVELRCPQCGDTAEVHSLTPMAPTCSCEALAVLAAEESTATLRALADPRVARPGRCCITRCHADGVYWRRTSLTPVGTRAVRACARHELLAEHLLSRLTMADAVQLATPAQRRMAQQIAARELNRAADLWRAGAATRGASSVTYSYALLAGAAAREAECQLAFARACRGGPARDRRGP